MSTNWYLRPAGACPQPCSSWLHLGKSSAGWVFTFRAYPIRRDGEGTPVASYEQWLTLLDQGDVYDEYGRQATRDELLAVIEASRDGHNDAGDVAYLDADGRRFIPVEFS